MPTIWRATDVLPTERTDSFAQLLSEQIATYGDLSDMVLGDEDEVHSASVGMLSVIRLRWSRGDAARSAPLIRRSDPELCKIDVPLSGKVFFEDRDNRAVAGAGTFTFVDLSCPHRVGGADTDAAAIYFPRALLPLRDDDITRLTGTTFAPAFPGSSLVTSVVREIISDLDNYEGPAGARISTAVFDLISATLAARLDRTAAVEPDSRQRVLVLRIRAFIEENLDDPDLTPPAIAARHHISLRFLHRLFEAEGTTVGGLIRARRLARCRKDLADLAQATKPVGAIAARWGYRDGAYFNRVFRAEHGMPPGEYRRSCLGRASDRRPPG